MKPNIIVNKLLRLVLQLILSAGGIIFLIIIDWRIALAVFAIVWASNMQVYDRVIDALVKILKG